MPRFSKLSDWLAWLETLHPTSIDLGLSRIYRVARQLSLLNSPSSISHASSGALASGAYVFTVAGTNGKGSCVTTIEHMLRAQNKNVGSYTSPHLHHYCERIKINGRSVDEAMVCDAFAAIDSARGDTSLTYFEFGTLAALWIFSQQNIPYVVLEVGLGGRLDAVNIVDANVAVVTSIAVDHEEWLGSDREKIAREKLGVTRPKMPVVIAETNLTNSLLEFIQFHRQEATVAVINDTFSATLTDHQHWYWHHNATSSLLPLPALPIHSVVAGLEALSLSDLLPKQDDISSILSSISLEGRYQQQYVAGREVIFDVAHNPAAATMLANRLRLSAEKSDGAHQVSKTFAVFSVMEDKDIAGIVSPLNEVIDHWFIGGLLNNSRAASISVTGKVLEQAGHTYTAVAKIEQAFDQALSQSSEHDKIVVFGSFFTVADVQTHIGHTYCGSDK